MVVWCWLAEVVVLLVGEPGMVSWQARSVTGSRMGSGSGVDSGLGFLDNGWSSSELASEKNMYLRNFKFEIKI